MGESTLSEYCLRSKCMQASPVKLFFLPDIPQSVACFFCLFLRWKDSCIKPWLGNPGLLVQNEYSGCWERLSTPLAPSTCLCRYCLVRRYYQFLPPDSKYPPPPPPPHTHTYPPRPGTRGTIFKLAKWEILNLRGQGTSISVFPVEQRQILEKVDHFSTKLMIINSGEKGSQSSDLIRDLQRMR